MCMGTNPFVDPPLSMEKDSLKEVTCELVNQAKKTNALLEELVKKVGNNSYERFQTDETGFLEFWRQVPFRDEELPNVMVASKTWQAALAWERGRKK